MRRILVTGGAGFLGSHLCETLLQQGNDVLCVDNFYTGRKANIAHLIGNPYFELIVLPIENYTFNRMVNYKFMIYKD